MNIQSSLPALCCFVSEHACALCACMCEFKEYVLGLAMQARAGALMSVSQSTCACFRSTGPAAGLLACTKSSRELGATCGQTRILLHWGSTPREKTSQQIASFLCKIPMGRGMLLWNCGRHGCLELMDTAHEVGCQRAALQKPHVGEQGLAFAARSSTYIGKNFYPGNACALWCARPQKQNSIQHAEVMHGWQLMC